MTNTKTWTTTLAFTCAVLVLSACELHTGSQSTPGSQTSPTGVAGIFGPRTSEKPMKPSAGGTSGDGASGSAGKANVTKPPEADAGAPVVKEPDAGAAQKPTSPNANMTMDASAAMPTTHPAGGGPAPANNTMDAAVADAQVSGAPSVTHKQQPPAAGSMADNPAGSPAMDTPIAGSPSTMPMDPACMPVFPGASCNAAPQCGCAAGQNCAYVTLEFPACLPPGAGGLNQACSLATDCQVGLQCIDGACLQLCDPNQQDCGEGVGCNQNYSSLNRPIPGYFTCSSNCNLVDPQRAVDGLVACGSGLSCYTFGSSADCARSGSAKRRHGEACDSSTDCAPGYACTDNHTCARWCETQKDCPDGYWCEDLNVKVLDKRYGLCRPTCGDMKEVACDVSSQCGCEGNMACDFVYQSERYIHSCRQIGRGASYSRCDKDEDCAAGASCVGGRCSPFCERDAECGGTYARCIQVGDGSVSGTPPIPGFHVCSRPCDPADLSRPHGAYAACGAGNACATSTDGLSYCRGANDKNEWQAECSDSSDCAAGYQCTSNYGCALMCELGYDCGTGFTCSSFNPRMFAGDEEWGVCVPVANTQ